MLENIINISLSGNEYCSSMVADSASWTRALTLRNNIEEVKMSKIPESDWKYLRKIKNDLLNEACNNIFLEIENLSKERKGKEYAAYLKLWDVIRKKDREISDMFDDLKRSNAIFKIANMLDYGVLPETYLMNFTNSTKKKVTGIVELGKEL